MIKNLNKNPNAQPITISFMKKKEQLFGTLPNNLINLDTLVSYIY